MYNTGTVIELARDGAIIMVSDCDFVLIKKKKGMFLGQQVCFSDVDIKIPGYNKIKLSAFAGAAAVFMILFALFFQYTKNSPIKNTYAFVDVDINPSIELLIDKDNQVLDIKAINNDAKELLKYIKTEKSPVGEVLAKVLETAENKGYIIPDSNNIVLVSVAYNPYYEGMESNEQKLQDLVDEIKHNFNANENREISPKIVKVSPNIKKLADKNGLSIGRQYIYEKSKEQNISIDLNDIKNGDLEYILSGVKITYEKMKETKEAVEITPSITKVPYEVPTPAPSPTPTITPEPTVTAIATPTPKPTPTVTVKPTPKKTVLPSPSKVSHDYAKVSGKIDGDRIILKWQPVSRKSGFKYYKVVASKSNIHPQYPKDGYLYAITDINSTTAVIDNSHRYNNGDFGAYFNKGEKYYFSITTVYEDGAVPGDVIVLTYPGSTLKDQIKLNVTGKVENGKIILNWNPAYVNGFKYYKIVISKNNPSPKYPEDGYLNFITDPNETTTVIDNANGYNGGDFGGYLEPGQKYYFSVTLVYEGAKIPGNAVYLTFPG